MGLIGKWFGSENTDAVAIGKPEPPALGVPSGGAPLAVALEPRFMFDAAGMAVGGEAAADVAAAQNDDGAGNDQQPAEDEALAEALATVPPPAAAPDRTEVVFIDAGVADHQSLLDGIDPAAEVVLLAADRDGVQQIADYLQGRNGIDAVHIVSHGHTGAVTLGSAVLSDATLDDYAEQLRTIGGGSMPMPT